MSKKTTEYESIPGMPKNLTPEQLQEMKRMGEAIKKQGKADQQKKIKCFAQLNRAAKDGRYSLYRLLPDGTVSNL